jgi:hypothetical protein
MSSKISSESEYEEVRRRKICENKAVLEQLGIIDVARAVQAPAGAVPRARASKRARSSEDGEKRRSSRRITGEKPADAGGADFDQAGRERAAGKRSLEATQPPQRIWNGQQFGDVGVSVGTVFGAGDYQRQGRFEMAANGFFEPVVQPEWLDPHTGCYSIILNNDNGQSQDNGDTIIYAGSGGRHRGQNRSAAQSFHQSWDNMTNATLRLNHTSGLPVRVIRGPKLAGDYSTAETGGGYRYDGLYKVTKAELLPTGSKMLRTAFFTLSRTQD